MTTRSRPAAALRTALDEVRSGYERARLAQLREPAQELDRSLLGRAFGWLSSASAQEALLEAADLGEVAPDEQQWLKRQLQFVTCMVPRLQAGARLTRALRGLRLPSDEAFDWPGQFARLVRVDDERARAGASRELEHALRPIAQRYAADMARALAPLHATAAAKPASPALPSATSGSLIVAPFSAEALAPPPAALPAAEWLEVAAAFLEATDAAAEDAVRHSLRAFKIGKPIPWHLLLRGLRAPELDSDSGAKQRWQRAAAWLHGLGFAAELQGRMRAEPDQGSALPSASVLPLAIPRDIRLAQSGLDYGVASDTFAAEGVGRALGLALCQGALPAELRWPLDASVAGVLGALALQLWGDRDQLGRVQKLSAAGAERVGRCAGTLALLNARACVALSCVAAIDAEDPRSGMETAAEALGRALCCEIPPSLAGLIAADATQARARGLEQMAALTIHRALRERFDADWFRNPRAGELLRAACERGNGLGPEPWCAELRTSLAGAALRAIELVA